MNNNILLKLALAAAMAAVAAPALAQSGGGTVAGTSGSIGGLGVDLAAMIPVSSPRVTLPTALTELPGGPIQGLREHFTKKE